MDIALKFKIVERIVQMDDEKLLNEIKSLVGLTDDDLVVKDPQMTTESAPLPTPETLQGESDPQSEVMAELINRFLKK
ncbi:hypothetical protein ADIARSV_1132 [Arcticibacter svalbardensis MN12-7]|uniref:Uncharacterized protein n=1 Tax=Arcticibacter svalbardensis MN12-7 TaxID=1150600 RepID=R9H3Q3_9SPHI|nr:hypothetical protein [Arcticibacter svalbardensis]EOR95819.1 hypothetical protein ADIARSV_1132 [Arcticibacter svalbardensis MN12-7]